MTTNLATILATKIRTALELNPDANPVHEALKLGQLAVLVNQAGLSLTPLPEQEQPRVASEVQRHPSGVEVVANRWSVMVDGRWAGLVSTDVLAVDGAPYRTYLGRAEWEHSSVDAAVSHLVAQQRTPSPERSIERGRDDAEEDSRLEAEAVQA